MGAATGKAKSLTNEAFDKVLEGFGSLDWLTSCKTHKDSEIRNGNRKAILTPKEGQEIPREITVGGLNLRTRYRGQAFFCQRCSCQHTEKCPVILEFQRCKAEKFAKTILTKIVSDSTLRLANSEAYRADLECMAGGQIGHIATSLQNDPKGKQYQEVVICAGRNTIESSLPLPKLVEINNNATKKINQYIQSNPEIRFHIITTVPLTKEPLYEPAREITQFRH